jgi:hypothetical protein
VHPADLDAITDLDALRAAVRTERAAREALQAVSEKQPFAVEARATGCHRPPSRARPLAASICITRSSSTTLLSENAQCYKVDAAYRCTERSLRVGAHNRQLVAARRKLTVEPRICASKIYQEASCLVRRDVTNRHCRTSLAGRKVVRYKEQIAKVSPNMDWASCLEWIGASGAA